MRKIYLILYLLALLIPYNNIQAIDVIPDLVSSSDTGESNTDDLTNENAPTFSVKCIQNKTIHLFLMV